MRRVLKELGKEGKETKRIYEMLHIHDVSRDYRNRGRNSKRK